MTSWHHGQCHFDEHLVNGGRVVRLTHQGEAGLIFTFDLKGINPTFTADTDDQSGLVDSRNLQV